MAEGENKESAAVVENDETCTITEFLDMQEEMEKDAYAVLGGSNHKNCSYDEGYIKRQALYVCLTCIPEAKEDPSKRAGICLACAYQCHDGHELVELFTKRNFRCDCGNKLFGDIACNLCKMKNEHNENNQYNQNFAGVYCTCHRPYPDPDDDVQDEMIQCIICEDWYHTRHLDAKVPDNYAEMVCGICVKKHLFLLNYDGLTVVKVTSSAEEAENVDVTSESTPKETESVADVEPCSANCKKPKAPSDPIISAKFFADITWREQLCTCTTCMKMYQDENVSYLTEPSDTVQSYETKGSAKAIQDEKEMAQKMFNEIPRVQILETIAGYNDLKQNLGEFFKKFKEDKKVIRVEDVKEFFAEMNARKKPKLDYQYYCK